jgi:glycosyltransferase involved in cell wall biosynthesis
MRVLNVAQTYAPFLAEGGRPAKVAILSRKLAGKGHRVTVLTADMGFGRPGAPPEPTERTPLGWRSEQDGIEAIYLRSQAHYRALTLNVGLRRFCRESLAAFDLVHIYGLYDLMGPWVAHDCHQNGIPYLIEPMGMFRAIDRSFLLKRIWHGTLGKAFIQNAAQIIATSELEQRELLEDGLSPEKVLLRYNGIDLEEFAELPPLGSFRRKRGIALDEPLVIFLGRIIPRKGAEVLIRAFARALPEKGRLVIAGPEGEPGYQRTLEECARQCSVRERVLFTGALYGEEKKAALRDAHVFVLPSQYENFANAAAEAMACQVPVILSNACGISALVDGRAGIIVPVDLHALVQALQEIFGNKPLYKRLKSGCGAVVSSLSWDQQVELMETHYVKVIRRAKRMHDEENILR